MTGFNLFGQLEEIKNNKLAGTNIPTRREDIKYLAHKFVEGGASNELYYTTSCPENKISDGGLIFKVCLSDLPRDIRADLLQSKLITTYMGNSDFLKFFWDDVNYSCPLLKGGKIAEDYAAISSNPALYSGVINMIQYAVVKSGYQGLTDYFNKAKEEVKAKEGKVINRVDIESIVSFKLEAIEDINNSKRLHRMTEEIVPPVVSYSITKPEVTPISNPQDTIEIARLNAKIDAMEVELSETKQLAKSNGEKLDKLLAMLTNGDTIKSPKVIKEEVKVEVNPFLTTKSETKKRPVPKVIVNEEPKDTKPVSVNNLFGNMKFNSPTKK